MKPILITLFVFTFVYCHTAPAQPKLWEVYSTSDQPFVNVTIDRYQSDTLYIKSMNQLIALHQDSIKYLLHRNSSQAGLGVLIGAVVGGVTVNAISHGSSGPFSEIGRFPSLTLGALVGGAIGGAIGSAQGSETKYRIDKLDPEGKRKLLNKLFPNIPSQ
jgi:hypothetical protein